MKIRRIWIFFLLVSVVALFGCQQEDLTELYPELYGGINYYDGGIVFRKGYNNLNSYYVEEPDAEDEQESDRYYDAPELQEVVTQHTRGLVLDNDPAILAYSWDLQPILIDFSCIPSDYFPYDAEHYANGIVMIEYGDNMYIEIAEDTTGKYAGLRYDAGIMVYVSETDGHIIHITSY